MDRGDVQQDNLASADGLEGVAADASTRVGEILAEAERYGRSLQVEAERDAEATRQAAHEEAERLAAEAREAVRRAADERADRLVELRAALTGRGPALLEGLEGEGLTRARLEALVEALVAAADRLIADAVGDGDPRGAAERNAHAEAAEPSAAKPADPAESADDAADAADAAEPADDAAEPADDAAEAADQLADGDARTGDDAVAAAGELAQLFDGAEESTSETHPADGGADGNGSDPQAFDGPLPEGAPLARKPLRSRERDARFAALLLAVQGRERDDVEAHLRSEYGFADCEPILDEVFGPARA